MLLFRNYSVKLHLKNRNYSTEIGTIFRNYSVKATHNLYQPRKVDPAAT